MDWKSARSEAQRMEEEDRRRKKLAKEEQGKDILLLVLVAGWQDTARTIHREISPQVRHRVRY